MRNLDLSQHVMGVCACVDIEGYNGKCKGLGPEHDFSSTGGFSQDGGTSPIVV